MKTFVVNHPVHKFMKTYYYSQETKGCHPHKIMENYQCIVPEMHFFFKHIEYGSQGQHKCRLTQQYRINQMAMRRVKMLQSNDAHR